MAVGDIDVAAATAALEASGGLPAEIPTTGREYNRDGHGRFSAPEQAPAEAVTPDPSAVAEQSTEAPAAPAAEEPKYDFTSITDEAILAGEVTAEQLVAMRRGMNADYTQKMQDIAPWRKLGNDLGIESPEDLRAAGELFAQLQDPRNWPQFQQELTDHMMSLGMSPQAASQAAANQLAEFAPAEDYQTSGEFVDDGSGVAQQLQALQQQVAQLTQGLQQRDAQAELMQRQNAIAQHLTQQETEIRSRTSYSDPEWETIYNMMGQDGNLQAAEQRYASAIAMGVQRYIGAKTAAVETTPTPAGNTAVISAQQPAAAKTLDEGHQRALAHIAALEAS